MKMPRLEEIANVALRVPSILMLDLLYKCDIDSFTEHLKAKNEDMLFKYKYVIWNLYYVGQIILSTLCAFLMKTRKVWLFSAHLLPLLARLCATPHATLVTVSSFAMVLTGLEVALFLISNLFVPYQLARAAYRELLQVEVLELYRLLALGITLWNQFAVPTLFSVFWFVLFLVQVYSHATSSNPFANHQGVLFVFLTSVSECCATPYSLLGLTFVVSYLALGLLNLCKFYVGGYAAVQNENVMHRGVTEGVTLLLLALQTGLLDMQVLQRTFLLSIILFIVVTSTLQSMIEITDPIILALGASRNRSVWRHCRGLSMCLLLLIFPGFMAYKISQFFHMDFWLLILVSSCMLTSLQVTGTLLIYSLFMVELARRDPIDSLDEIIYCVNAVSRVLEFLVALCVVAYGTWESLLGEWSWMGASVIIIHSYFNVWLRAQSGWRSFLLRREAAHKINSLPRATDEQLRRHNDVCAICFQEMSSAVVTLCGHFFHGNCLRKWLYVQETCPMCHQPVKPTASPQGPAAEAQEGAAPAGEAENRAPGFGREEEAGPEQTAEGDPGRAEEAGRGENTQAPADAGAPPDLSGVPVRGLRFNASGHFVGLATPEGAWSGADPWAWALEEERLEGRNGAGLHGRPDDGAKAGMVSGDPEQTEQGLPPLAAGGSSHGGGAWGPQNSLWGKGLDGLLLGKSHTSVRGHEADTTGIKVKESGPQETTSDRLPQSRTPLSGTAEEYDPDGVGDVSRGSTSAQGDDPDAGSMADGLGQDPGPARTGLN
ncbi:RING finger protein 145 isoform X2 [Anguilla rostrata]|uniref:RING finger protein 145 isoform X2 n=1 Tax=Anguilla rostrata TaxID=7938 RepID=UPI0030CD3252